MKEYGLYDVKDYEQCICLGSISEIANYLKCSENSLRSYLSKKKSGAQQLLQHRYELIEIFEEVETEGCTKRKSNKEIFQEIIKEFSGLTEILTLKEKINELEIFDEFKWTLKGIVDK